MPALIRETWNEDAEQALKISAGNDMAAIRADVREGIAGLFRCEDGGELEARTVLRVEGDELVIVLGEGKNARKWINVIEHYAREIGAKTLRTHITRAGLRRIYEAKGWQQREIVMSRTL